jgi:hypothetical protein
MLLGAAGIEEESGVRLPIFLRNVCNNLRGNLDYIPEENNLELDLKYGLLVVTPCRLQKARRFGRILPQSSVSKRKPSR